MPDKRQWRLLLVQTVLLTTVVGMLRPATSYKALDLGVQTAWLGMISASFALVPLFIALPAGRLTDRIGQRRPLQIGAVLIATAAAGFALAGDGLGLLLAWSAVLGIGHLFAVIATQTLVADMWEPSRHDVAFGAHAFAASTGQLFGPGILAVFGGSSAQPDTTQIFAAAAGIGMLIVVISALMRIPSRSQQAASAARNAKVGAALRVPGMGPAVFTSLAVPVAVDLLAVYLPALGQERSISARAIGILLAVRAASSMMSRFFLGPLARTVGRQRLLIGGLVIAAVAIAVIPMPMPISLLGVVVAAAGFGIGVSQPLILAWVAGAAPFHVRATALALRLSGNRLGQVVAPSAIGLIASTAGTAGVLWLTAGVLSLAAMTSTRVR